MREMTELRRQIIRILIQQDASLSPLLAKPITPPTPAQNSLLRQVALERGCEGQIIVASFLDHVARMMTPSEARDIEIPRGKVPYVTTSMNENTAGFIHRESFVLPLKQSDFVRVADAF